jgi:hypothetical protein
MVDRLARTVESDPAEARRRNFIRSDEMPYDVGMLYRDGTAIHLSMMAGTSTPPLRLRLKPRATERSAKSRRRLGAGECIAASASPQDHHGARDALADPVPHIERPVVTAFCRQAASLVNSAHRSPERPDDSRPAGAGHPHVPAVGAAVELAATPMLLEEGVQVVKEAGHGRQCSSEGGREPWVVIWRTRGSRA